MQWRLSLIGGLAVIALSVSIATAAVYSGKIESINGRQVVVRLLSKGTQKTFEVGASTQLTLDGKKVTLDDLTAGQAVAVTTDAKDQVVTKIAARDAGDAPASKPATKAPAKAAKKAGNDDAGSPRSGTVAAAPGDWPQYRGPNRDNMSTETGLLDRWPDSGPPLAWQISGLGEGYSSVALVGDVIYTMGTNGRDQELLIALDRANGQRKWATPLGRYRGDGQGGGPRGTPTVEGDRVYALSSNGDLVCCKTDTGSVVWQGNILREFGGNNITWGISESVLLDGERLICTPGGKGGTMVALNKANGRTIWTANVPGAPQAAYSSPIAIDVGGVRQYVNFVHTAVVGVRAADGQPLWGQPQSANGTANCSTALFADNLVFTASGYGTGCALFQLASSNNQTKADVRYSNKDMKNHHGGMVLKDGFVYGFDEQILTCLDLRTGRPAWQNRSVGKGAVTYADGKLFLRSESGPIGLCEASPKGYNELGRFDQPDRSDRPAWAHPVVAGGQLFLRDWDRLLVYNVK